MSCAISISISDRLQSGVVKGKEYRQPKLQFDLKVFLISPTFLGLAFQLNLRFGNVNKEGNGFSEEIGGRGGFIKASDCAL